MMLCPVSLQRKEGIRAESHSATESGGTPLPDEHQVGAENHDAPIGIATTKEVGQE